MMIPRECDLVCTLSQSDNAGVILDVHSVMIMQE